MSKVHPRLIEGGQHLVDDLVSFYGPLDALGGMTVWKQNLLRPYILVAGVQGMNRDDETFVVTDLSTTRIAYAFDDLETAMEVLLKSGKY